jgi:hypothetical protein
MRRFRGRKPSIVRPSRYCSTTAGETYEFAHELLDVLVRAPILDVAKLAFA